MAWQEGNSVDWWCDLIVTVLTDGVTGTWPGPHSGDQHGPRAYHGFHAGGSGQRFRRAGYCWRFVSYCICDFLVANYLVPNFAWIISSSRSTNWAVAAPRTVVLADETHPLTQTWHVWIWQQTGAINLAFLVVRQHGTKSRSFQLWCSVLRK